jgi:hypothetical protein
MEKKVYILRATGAIRGTPAGMKLLIPVNGTKALLRFALIISAGLYHRQASLYPKPPQSDKIPPAP